MINMLLPVHNGKERTARFLDCLDRQEYRDFRLILIDDGSTDGTADMVRKRYSSAVIITGSGDWWWAGALQQGYLWLKQQVHDPSDLTLIMNNDTIFDPEFLAGGVRLMAGKQKTFLFACNYNFLTKELYDAGVRADWSRFTFKQAEKPDEINCLSTRGLFMRTADFLSTGGFRPKLLPHYTSDYEFTIRAKRRGITLAATGEIKLWYDPEQGGYYREIDDLPLIAFLRRYFSKKSVNNPCYFSVFIALAAPWRFKLRCWAKVWFKAFLRITNKIRRDVRCKR